MASPSDIATVHKNVNEPTEATYTDAYINSLIEAEGVAGASAIIWEQKAAGYVELVNTSEAGASHSFSDLHKNALNMAAQFRKDQVATTAETSTAGRVRVRKIVRS